MAGVIKVDRVQSDSNLAFNIAGANVAFMDAASLQLVGSSIVANGTTIVSGSKVVSSAQPTGAVLQVSQVTATDVISATGGTFTDIPTLQVTITPTSATSKFLLIPNFHIGSASATYQIMFRAYRVVGGTETWIGQSVTAGSRTQTSFVVGQQGWENYDILQTSWQYLDSPATTSAVTYKFKWADPRDSSTHYIGRSLYDADDKAVSRSTSLFTVMEIAG